MKYFFVGLWAITALITVTMSLALLGQALVKLWKICGAGLRGASLIIFGIVATFWLCYGVGKLAYPLLP